MFRSCGAAAFLFPRGGSGKQISLAYHPRACAFRYAEREGEGNCGLALPVADSAMPQFPQRSKNARSSASPKRFSGTARRIGRPQTTLEDIPANFLWHYPQYKNGAFNLTELARLCDISRTTAYKVYRAVGGKHRNLSLIAVFFYDRIITNKASAMG